MVSIVFLIADVKSEMNLRSKLLALYKTFVCAIVIRIHERKRKVWP